MRVGAVVLIWWAMVYLGGAFIQADWVWLADVMSWGASDRGLLLFEVGAMTIVAGVFADLLWRSKP